MVLDAELQHIPMFQFLDGISWMEWVYAVLIRIQKARTQTLSDGGASHERCTTKGQYIQGTYMYMVACAIERSRDSEEPAQEGTCNQSEPADAGAGGEVLSITRALSMAAHPVSLSEASGPPIIVGASRASAMTRREATTLPMGVVT